MYKYFEIAKCYPDILKTYPHVMRKIFHILVNDPDMLMLYTGTTVSCATYNIIYHTHNGVVLLI